MTVKVKSVSPNGRIVYDAESILSSPCAQKHLKGDFMIFFEINIPDDFGENVWKPIATAYHYNDILSFECAAETWMDEHCADLDYPEEQEILVRIQNKPETVKKFVMYSHTTTTYSANIIE